MRLSLNARILALSAGILLLPGFLCAQPATPTASSADLPISGVQRLYWFGDSTVGPQSLAVGVVSAAWGTARNKPEERGPHWRGFAERYGIRLTGVATGNAIEAGLGALWGEDPRYFRSTERGAWERIRHAAVTTVITSRANGNMEPAYARYAGIVGGNFLSNTWRKPSENSTGDALTRSLIGFAGRFVGNVFDEVWPDIQRKIRGQK